MGVAQILSRGAACVIAAALASCTVGPDYLKPQAITPASFKEIKGWRAASPRDDAAKGDWWRIFHDSELDAYEAQVAISNQTLKADEANYRAAQALISEARAGLFPSLGLDPTHTRSGPPAGNLLNAEVSGTWSPDIWGKVRRQIEQNGAAAQASAADLANATLQTQSLLASAYFQVRQADSLHDLLADTVKQYQHSLDIAQNQYKAGTTAKSDVITAQAQWLAAQAQLVASGIARKQNEHAIAVLMGKVALEVSVSHRDLAQATARPPVGLPSTLLERRPDIAAAECNMQAQNAAIGVAIAAYYPDLTLSGAYGYRGDPFLKQLAGVNPIWSYGASLAQTLLNGGLTQAQVEAAQASYDASVATYRQTVLTAFQQVEDELSALAIYDREIAIQREAVRVARQSVTIALNEYRAGTQNFTTVVTAQASALADEQSLLATRGARVQALVALVVALGGGYEAAP